jgi:hypothetical protein
MMGCYVFVEVGKAKYYYPHNADRVARTAEVIFLLSLGVSGLFAGQVVRQARRLVDGYPVRVKDTQEAA